MQKRFRYALIGCGKVAKKHIRSVMHNKDLVEMVAIVDTNRNAIDNLLVNSSFTKEELSKIIIYSDYRIMLDEQKPDIVAITTPSGTHAEIGLEIIRRGINILIEKPMTLNLLQAINLVDEAAKYNVKIAVGHIYRFFPLVEQLVVDIRNNVYGEVLYGNVKVYWGHDQAYYDQASWRGTWKQDGGVLMNQSIHALDLMCWLMGGKASEVTGMIARQNHKMEAEDLGLGIIKFENDTYCTIEGTTNTNPQSPEASFYILCTKGFIKAGIKSGKPYLEIRDQDNKNRSGHYIMNLLKSLIKSGKLSSIMQFGNPHSGILRDLCIAIIENRDPRADGNSGRDSLELVLALYKSAKTKKSVSLPVTDFSTEDMQGFFE